MLSFSFPSGSAVQTLRFLPFPINERGGVAVVAGNAKCVLNSRVSAFSWFDSHWTFFLLSNLSLARIQTEGLNGHEMTGCSYVVRGIDGKAKRNRHTSTYGTQVCMWREEEDILISTSSHRWHHFSAE